MLPPGLGMNSFAALGDSDDEEVIVEKKPKAKVEKTEGKDTKKKEDNKSKVNSIDASSYP